MNQDEPLLSSVANQAAPREDRTRTGDEAGPRSTPQHSRLASAREGNQRRSDPVTDPRGAGTPVRSSTPGTERSPAPSKSNYISTTGTNNRAQPETKSLYLRSMFASRGVADEGEGEDEHDPHAPEILASKLQHINTWLVAVDPLEGLGSTEPDPPPADDDDGDGEITEYRQQLAHIPRRYSTLEAAAASFTTSVESIPDLTPEDSDRVPSYPTSRSSSLAVSRVAQSRQQMANTMQEMFNRKKEEEKQRTLNRILTRMGLSAKDDLRQRISAEGAAPQDGGFRVSKGIQLGRISLRALKSVTPVWTWTGFRARVASLAFHPDFENFILLLIIGNCVTLALFRPREAADSPWNNALKIADLSLNGLFSLELLMRMISDTSFRSYVKSPWNLFDLSMVIIGWTDLIPSSSSNNSIKALRALRALRPLRTITRVLSLRAIVVCFLESIPLLVSTIGLYIFILLMFAITAMQIFQTAYHRDCYDLTQNPPYSPNDDPNASFPGEFGCGGWRKCPAPFQCLDRKVGRGPYVPGFDNLLSSLLSVIQIIFLSNWSYIMYRTVDSTGWYVVIYYIPAVMLGSIFMLNLFLAVLKSKFGHAQTLYRAAVAKDATILARSKQKSLVNGALQQMKSKFREKVEAGRVKAATKRMAIDATDQNEVASLISTIKDDTERPWYLIPPPKDAGFWVHLRHKAAKLVHSQYFSAFFMALICLNTVALAIEYYGMSDRMRLALYWANVVFTALFGVEVALKVFGLSLAEYISDGFNWFDLLIVIASIVELAASTGGSLSSLRAFRTVRIVRVLRLIRFLKVFKSLYKITTVIGGIMGSFLSVTALLAVFVFVYTIIGLHAFGTYHLPPDNVGLSFSSFLLSLTLVFQLLTNEDWNTVMWEVTDNTGKGSLFFFLTWVILSKFVLLTLFLAVILESFESKYDEDVAKEALQIQKAMDKMTKKDHLKRVGTTREREARKSEKLPGHSEANGGAHSSESLQRSPSKYARQPSSAAPRSQPLGKSPLRNVSAPEDATIANGLPSLPPASELVMNGHGASSLGPDCAHTADDRPAAAPRKRGVRFEGPVAESARTAHGTTSPLIVSPEIVPWGRGSRIQPLELQSSAYLTAAGPSSSRLAPHAVGEMFRSRKLGPASASEQNGSNGSGDPEPSAMEDDRSEVMSQASTTANSEVMENVKIAMEAQYLLAEGEGDETASVAASSVKLQQEIALGIKEDEGKMNHHQRKKAALKRKFNPSAPVPYGGVSLFLFKPQNRVRQWVYKLVNKKKFDYVMFFVILVNCGMMVYDRPSLSPNSTAAKVLSYSDLAFTIIFSVEATLKIFAFGFMPYIKRASNFVDFLIVIISILLQILVSSKVQFLKGLRVLRAFKPVRMLTRSAGMQLVLRSLILSLASIGNVTLLMFFLLLIFGILGVQLFGGQFWSCNDPSVAGKAQCIGTFIPEGATEAIARQWSNATFNFDNLAQALQSLFVVMLLDGFMPIIRSAQSVNGVDKQPRFGSNMAAIFYFIAFIVLIVYCMLNLYVGVMFFEFTKIRLYSQTGSAFLTTEQQEWLEMVNLLSRIKPKEKPKGIKSPTRRKFLEIADSKWFEYFMLFIITINMGFLAAVFYEQPSRWTRILGYSEYVFTIIFIVELFIKVIAYGPRIYWRNDWNKMDFVIVLVSIMGAAAQIASTVRGASGLHALRSIQNILRVFRLLRMLRLIRTFPGMRSLLQTLVYSLPAFWNIGALLFLLFFIYAYIGVIFFGKVKLGESLNYHANFRDFGMALITLFRVATADGWTGIMEDCMVMPPACDRKLDNCGTYVAIPYFYSFILLIAVIMFNLFTAAIIENFEKQENREGWRLEASHIETFVEEWAHFDDGSGTISHADLRNVLLNVPPPLGLKGVNASQKDIVRFLQGLDMTMDKATGKLPFQRTLFELVKRVSAAEIPEGMLKQQIDKTVAKITSSAYGGEEISFAVFLSVRRIQMAWKAKMQERRINARLSDRSDRVFIPEETAALLSGPDANEYLQMIERAIHEATKAVASNKLPESDVTKSLEAMRKQLQRMKEAEKLRSEREVKRSLDRSSDTNVGWAGNLLGLAKINVRSLFSGNGGATVAPEPTAEEEQALRPEFLIPLANKGLTFRINDLGRAVRELAQAEAPKDGGFGITKLAKSFFVRDHPLALASVSGHPSVNSAMASIHRGGRSSRAAGGHSKDLSRSKHKGPPGLKTLKSTNGRGIEPMASKKKALAHFPSLSARETTGRTPLFRGDTPSPVPLSGTSTPPNEPPSEVSRSPLPAKGSSRTRLMLVEQPSPGNGELSAAVSLSLGGPSAGERSRDGSAQRPGLFDALGGNRASRRRLLTEQAPNATMGGLEPLVEASEASAVRVAPQNGHGGAH